MKIYSILPMFSCNTDAINDSTLNDTTSPIEAAKGVAKLSGFKLYLCEISITATRTTSEKINVQIELDIIEFKIDQQNFMWLL